MNHLDEVQKLQDNDNYDSIGKPKKIDENYAEVDKSRVSIEDNNAQLEQTKFSFTNLINKIKSFLIPLKDKFLNWFEKLDIQQSRKKFIIIILIGILFDIISVFNLPMIIIAPQQFALNFGFGNLLILISFLFYFGGKDYINKLINSDRKWITLIFFLSMLFGMIFAFEKRFLMSLLFSLLQIISLVIFLKSFIGGDTDLGNIFNSGMIIFGGIFERIKGMFVNILNTKSQNNGNAPENIV